MRYHACGHRWLWCVLWDVFAHTNPDTAQAAWEGLGFRGGRVA